VAEAFESRLQLRQGFGVGVDWWSTALATFKPQALSNQSLLIKLVLPDFSVRVSIASWALPLFDSLTGWHFPFAPQAAAGRYQLISLSQDLWRNFYGHERLPHFPEHHINHRRSLLAWSVRG
jgi:hypothetical protein